MTEHSTLLFFCSWRNIFDWSIVLSRFVCLLVCSFECMFVSCLIVESAIFLAKQMSLIGHQFCPGFIVSLCFCLCVVCFIRLSVQVSSCRAVGREGHLLCDEYFIGQEVLLGKFVYIFVCFCVVVFIRLHLWGAVVAERSKYQST